MFPIRAFGPLVVPVLDRVQHTVTHDGFCHLKPIEADNSRRNAGSTDELKTLLGVRSYMARYAPLLSFFYEECPDGVVLGMLFDLH